MWDLRSLFTIGREARVARTIKGHWLIDLIRLNAYYSVDLSFFGGDLTDNRVFL